MAKKADLRAANRIVMDEGIIELMLQALEQALPALEQGQHYQGEVLEDAAAVREAIKAGRLRLGGKL